MTLDSAALGVTIRQACDATGENQEQAVLKQLLGELDLPGMIQTPGPRCGCLLFLGTDSWSDWGLRMGPFCRSWLADGGTLKQPCSGIRGKPVSGSLASTVVKSTVG